MYWFDLLCQNLGGLGSCPRLRLRFGLVLARLPHDLGVPRCPRTLDVSDELVKSRSLGWDARWGCFALVARLPQRLLEEFRGP